MSTVYVVIAFGGQWDDSWEHPVCACKSEAEAEQLIGKLEHWLKEIRAGELPESLQEWHFDESDEEDMCRRDIMMQEWQEQILIDLGVPEVLRPWLEENWEFSHCCEFPMYKITEVPVL